MALRVAALFLLLSTPAVYAVQHVVGGPGGSWSTAGGYSTWAAGETFNVGDTLRKLPTRLSSPHVCV